MLRENYSLGQLKRIFLERLHRERAYPVADRFEEAVENLLIMWRNNGEDERVFSLEAATRNVMSQFGYLGDDKEIEIHRSLMEGSRERSEKWIKRLVDDNGDGDEEEFDRSFDIRGDILWVYRNFARVVTRNDTGDVFLDWENAVGKAPTAGALMYMEMAARDPQEFLTKIAPKILFSPKRAAAADRVRDRQQDNRINHALSPPLLNPPRMDEEPEMDVLPDSISPPFVPDAPSPDENGDVEPDYEFAHIPAEDIRQIRKQEEREIQEQQAEQERLEAEEWIRTRSQIPAEDLESAPLMDALKRFHEKG